MNYTDLFCFSVLNKACVGAIWDHFLQEGLMQYCFWSKQGILEGSTMMNLPLHWELYDVLNAVYEGNPSRFLEQNLCV